MTGIGCASDILFSCQLCHQSLAKPCFVFDLALPDRQDSPPLLLKRQRIALIAFDVPVEFSDPELRTRLRQYGIFAALVPVPEAAMHKYRYVPALEDDVRASRQLLILERKPKAKAMKQRADALLGARIATPDAAHVPAPSFGRKLIHDERSAISAAFQIARRHASAFPAVTSLLLQFPLIVVKPYTILARLKIDSFTFKFNR
jgi:hypothetical protein